MEKCMLCGAETNCDQVLHDFPGLMDMSPDRRETVEMVFRTVHMRRVDFIKWAHVHCYEITGTLRPPSMIEMENRIMEKADTWLESNFLLELEVYANAGLRYFEHMRDFFESGTATRIAAIQ